MSKQSEEQKNAKAAMELAIKRCEQAGIVAMVYFDDDQVNESLMQRLTKTVDELTAALKEEREEVATQVRMVDRYKEQRDAWAKEARSERQRWEEANGVIKAGDMTIAGLRRRLERAEKERDEYKNAHMLQMHDLVDARAWAHNLLKQRDYWKKRVGDYLLVEPLYPNTPKKAWVEIMPGCEAYMDIPGPYVDIDPKDVRLCSLCNRPMALYVTMSIVDDKPLRHYYCDVCNHVEH